MFYQGPVFLLPHNSEFLVSSFLTEKERKKGGQQERNDKRRAEKQQYNKELMYETQGGESRGLYGALKDVFSRKRKALHNMCIPV